QRAPAGERFLHRGALARREADQQDPRAGEIADRGAGVLGLLLEVDLDPERAAQADRALQADAPAHQEDELLRDRGAQAAAAEAARGRLVGLGEALEDLRLRLGRDADAGVAD